MPSYSDLLQVHNGYYTWPKYSSVKFNQYFKTDEFRCRCGYVDCNEQRLSVDMIDKLTSLREEFGAAITITSGFRCKKHQDYLRSVPGVETAKSTSTHELGHAADIKAAELDRLYSLLHKHFRAIGKARTFFHVDLRADRERRWDYV